MVAGVSPPLVHDGLRMAADELEHARLSLDVCAAVGASGPPVVDRAELRMPERHGLAVELDLAPNVVRLGCLGETVAVPLFRLLRRQCTRAPAVVALDRILRDEGRHRTFGWSVLDWLLESPASATVRTEVDAQLPDALTGLVLAYGTRDDGHPLTSDERAWGLASPSEYAEVLASTLQDVILPELAARGFEPTPPVLH